MSAKTIILDAGGKAKALSWLNKAPSDRSWKITFAENKTTRSVAQNALMWAWFTAIASHLTDNTDQNISKDDMHDYFVELLLPKKVVNVLEKFIVKQTGTSDLNVAEMSDFLMRVEGWAAHRRIPIEKDEYYEQAMGIKS